MIGIFFYFLIYLYFWIFVETINGSLNNKLDLKEFCDELTATMKNKKERLRAKQKRLSEKENSEADENRNVKRRKMSFANIFFEKK